MNVQEAVKTLLEAFAQRSQCKIYPLGQDKPYFLLDAVPAGATRRRPLYCRPNLDGENSENRGRFPYFIFPWCFFVGGLAFGDGRSGPTGFPEDLEMMRCPTAVRWTCEDEARILPRSLLHRVTRRTSLQPARPTPKRPPTFPQLNCQ